MSSSSLSELMLYSVQGIYNHLLLYVAQDRSSVVWGLNMLDANVTKSITSSDAASGESSSDGKVMMHIE